MQFTITRAVLALSAVVATVQATNVIPDSYNVVWTTPSRNSSESMPVGGGDIGLNVWSENSQSIPVKEKDQYTDMITDTILFYIAKSGTFDENNSMVKLGRVRLTLDPNPFSGKVFKQTLKLNDGYILLEGSSGTSMKIWVDVFNPVTHVELKSNTNIAFTAAYESWRYEDRVMGLRGKNRAEQGMFDPILRATGF